MQRGNYIWPKNELNVPMMLTQALIDGGCAFPNSLSWTSPLLTPLQSENKKPTAAISCLVLCSLNLRPSLPTITPHLSTTAPVLAFWLSGFSPAPSPLHPHGPPLTPCYPHPPPHPPSPQGKPTASSPLCLQPPSFSSTSTSLCLCVWEASKGSEEREAAEETGAGEGSYRSDVKQSLSPFYFDVFILDVCLHSEWSVFNNLCACFIYSWTLMHYRDMPQLLLFVTWPSALTL